MKTPLLLALATTATLFTTTIFASTSWSDYLSQVEYQVNNYDPTVFVNMKEDKSLTNLEAAITKLLMEMKTYAVVQSKITQPLLGSKITDFDGYLTSLDAELSAVVIPFSLTADPEFAKMEDELIALMAQLQKK